MRVEVLPEIAPSEQVGAGVPPPVTLQVKVTAVGASPPTVVMVMVAVAEEPGATVEADSGEAARLKPGPITFTLAVDVLAVKSASPL